MLEKILSLSIKQSLSLLNKKNSILSGVIKEANPIIALFLAINSLKNTIIVAEDDEQAQYLYQIIKLFNSTKTVHFFPSLKQFPYQQVSSNKSILTQRMKVLCNLTDNAVTVNKTKQLVITSKIAFIEKTIPQKYLENKFFTIKTNTTLDVDALIKFLINNNYQRVSMVTEESQFIVRGDIIDIYCTEIGAVRIDLFDNTVDKIKLFDVYTQKTTEIIEECIIKPSSEIILEQKNIDTFKYQYRSYFHKVDNTLFEQLDSQIMPKGIENYLPLFYDESSTIINFLNNPQIILCPNIVNLVQEVIEQYQTEYEYLKDSKSIFKENIDILKPEQLLLSNDAFQSILQNNDCITLNAFKIPEDENTLNLEINDALTVYNLYKQKHNDYYSALLAFIKDNNINNNKYHIVILCSSTSFYNHIENLLKDNAIIYNNNNDKNSILLLKDTNIHNGFILNNTFIISEFEITGIKKTFSNKKRISNKKILEHLTAISVGDIVVHNKHGLGKYFGITTLSTNGSEHDFLEIHYARDEKLYIPVENIDTISRYGTALDNVVLDRLGSNNFEKKQAKIKEKIKDIAYDLIKTSAQRKTSPSNIINYDTELYDAFVKEFPYVETDDQLNAVNSIIDDLSSGYPSDRLVCGDVGFGKTEVAMRAAFIVASSGKAVAMITPTTLLCRQHYNNFVKRFENFPLKVAQLSKFVTPKEKKQIKEDLEAGKIDIVIGTHALLADNIKFKELGLVIVDEEQSFGVLHKEKLKKLQTNAHVLTLTATPIPRTIQLALKGIKELSLITTPPINKLPINTYILPHSLLTISNAILKEIDRGGQVYFVTPRIAHFYELESYLQQLKINNYVMIHGQMSPNEIETRMIAFQNKEYDILLSTNIIESGLDLANVNTIIIEHPELFGLAQLYQLRGRVGRGKNQSYAYLLYNKNKVLSPQAEKRLQLLQSLDYLGAGFALASYDLELRGAGNIVGEEQSGHIKEIGFELYQKLLEKEIYNLKNNINNNDIEFSPDINLGIPVLIPKKYISDIETSIEFYQRLGRVNDYSEIEILKDEMIDRFGKFPPQVDNLFISINLKLKCKKALVEKLVFGNKGIMLSFYQGKFSEPEKLLNYIQENHQGLISLKPDGKLFLHTINLDIKEQINLASILLRNIAELLDS